MSRREVTDVADLEQCRPHATPPFLEGPLAKTSTKSVMQVKNSGHINGAALDRVDTEILDFLKEWDVNGDGHFSVEEVIMVAKKFRKTERKVKVMGRTLIVGAIVMASLLAAILFVTFAAVQLAKDTRPNHGIITTNDGRVAAMAHVLRQSNLESIPSMLDEDLAQLQFVSFDIGGERHNPKIATSVRRTSGANGTQGSRPIVDIFFVGGSYSKMTIDHDVKVQRSDGTWQVLDGGDIEGRHLQDVASAPWSHITGATRHFVGLSGAPWTHIGDGSQPLVAGAPWTHITR
jgi:hypothetical protein